MAGHLLLQGAVILWLVQAAYTGGYSPASRVSNGQGPQSNGYKPQNGGGVETLSMPSKGVGRAMGPRNGYSGYPTKGVGYGPAAEVTNGQSGKQQGGGIPTLLNRNGGYGLNSGYGLTNGQQMKAGYGAQAGGYGGQGTKGNGYGLKAGPTSGQQMKAGYGGYGGQGTKGYGNPAAAAARNGLATKGNGGNPAVLPSRNAGYGLKAGPTSGQQMKAGYGAQAGGYGGQGTKGNGDAAAAAAQDGLATKGNGYGHQIGSNNGQQMKAGYGAQAGGYGGQASNGNGYGLKAGPTSGQQMKAGYGAQAGGYGGQGTKGNGDAAAAAAQDGLATKGNGYGHQIGSNNGQQMKAGYGAQAGGYGGQASNGNGYGLKAGPTSGQQMKAGYGAQAGGYGGQGTKGNGNGAQAGGYNGQGVKGNGYGLRPGTTTGKQMNGYGAQTGVYGGTKGNGNAAAAARNALATKGQGGAGSKPMKGYGRPPYGQGPGVGMGAFRSLGVPQLARNQGKAYGGDGYNSYRPQPVGGGYGRAGMALGHHYGGQGMKGPMQGYGNPSGGTAKLAKPGFGNLPNGYGSKPNGYGGPNGGVPSPLPGFGNGVVPSGFGSKPNGYGAAAGAGAFKGYGPRSNGRGFGNGAALGGYGAQPNGYGTMPNGKGQAVKGAGVSSGMSLKGGVFSAPQQTAAMGGVTPQQMVSQGQIPAAPEPTRGIFGMVTQDRYQQLPAPQGKNYKQKPFLPEATPEPAAFPAARDLGPGPQSALKGLQDKGQKGATFGPVVQQSQPGFEPAAVLPQESRGASGYKGQGHKAAKIGYGTGGPSFPGLMNRFGAGLGYPYGGKTAQPGYGQGAYPAPAYGNAYGNGYGAQPDYASKGLGQGLPTADGKSGGTRQLPFNGAPVVPARLDGKGQFEPQSAGLGPNGNLGNTYGGLGGPTFGMGAEKSNAKYGVGGQQFDAQPKSAGVGAAGNYGYGVNPYGPSGEGKSSGKYGGLGAGMGGVPAPANYGYGSLPNGGQPVGTKGNAPGKYGYGRLPYAVQQARLGPEAKSTGQYGLIGSQYQPEAVGLGPNGMSTGKYGGQETPYVPQNLGFGSEAQSGKYDEQRAYKSQSLGSAAEAGLTYGPQTLEPDSAEKSYVKGVVPTPALAVEQEGMPINRYENVAYINAQMQQEVGAFPAAASPSPDPSVPLEYFTPDEILGGVQDLPGSESRASLGESAPNTETLGEAQASEHPDDPQQLPRQIHIQQHLKLHFHSQEAKDGKYDLNGFLGNRGYQG
ncbi:calymmin [Cololabis saira]|uniref:calymmin n=1 Tax=Cololabis saira TaxID=129043 RepID=UPI002AD2C44B|nr:calymmin [Cololabis saira]